MSHALEIIRDACPAAPNTPYLDTSLAAGYLLISRRTLERLRLTGDGPRYAKAGRRVLYRRDWLDEWLAGRTFTSTSSARSNGIR